MTTFNPTDTGLTLTDLDGLVLSQGAHTPGQGQQCALEAINLLLSHTLTDKVPECLSPCLAMIPALNDEFGDDDAARTAAIRPYIPELMALERDPVRDQQRAFALADYAVRVIAAEVTGDSRLVELEPIVDERTGRAAARAAAWVAEAAACAAEAAEAATLTRHTHGLLRALVKA